MSTFNPLLSVKFDEDPSERYHEMKVAMEILAGTICCDLFDTGLAGQGVHLLDTEYVRQRPTKARPTQPAQTAAKIVYGLYREVKEDYIKYITGMQTYLVDACKPKIMRGMSTTFMPITMTN